MVLGLFAPDRAMLTALHRQGSLFHLDVSWSSAQLCKRP
ncbi:hypothetical protein SynSYN20_00830 [Synechococcus sp. SYN20]|nr:hypothetical protein SynSYN20_00830 [Synechococcus sp. SYN20]